MPVSGADALGFVTVALADASDPAAEARTRVAYNNLHAAARDTVWEELTRWHATADLRARALVVRSWLTAA